MASTATPEAAGFITLKVVALPEAVERLRLAMGGDAVSARWSRTFCSGRGDRSELPERGAQAACMAGRFGADPGRPYSRNRGRAWPARELADEEVAGRRVLGGEPMRVPARTEPPLKSMDQTSLGPGVCEGLVPWGGPAAAFASLDQTGPGQDAGRCALCPALRNAAATNWGPTRDGRALDNGMAWRWGARLRSRRPSLPWAS